MSIEICHVCDGYGYANVADPDSLVIEKISCQRCEGFGRLIRTTSYDSLSSHGFKDELVEAARNLLNQVEMSSPSAFRSSVAPERAKLLAILSRPPMKLHFTNDQLKAQIERDGDEEP